MIFMPQMQHNAPNSMHVFQHFSGGDTRGLPFGEGNQNRAPPLQNLGYAPEACQYHQDLCEQIKRNIT